MSQLSFFITITWTVTELTRFIRKLLVENSELQDIWVRGEVSNFTRHSSGHVYFTLKDSNSSLKCVMWRNSVIRQLYLPKDGEAVEVHGKIDVFESGGQYQLYADTFRSIGEGALFQEFLRLKSKLENEGLFDPQRKRPIPALPKRIGIVTSPTGAALRDILNTIRRRFPLVEVFVSPTAVQGAEAPPGIVAAIEELNQKIHPDVILLARGGGSIEDLWAFNDERVARAIAASQAPIISGVGHETDFTIADFVSDLRAPTPTASAELATPNREDITNQLIDIESRLDREIESMISKNKMDFANLSQKLLFYSPITRIRSYRQRLDEYSLRLVQAIEHLLSLRKIHLNGVQNHLEAMNPKAILERGYAIVTHLNGEVVRQIAQIHPKDHLNIRITDGTFPVEVIDK